jgi:hypothetical protein
MARHRAPCSVRSSRDLARCGMWSTSVGGQLDLPIHAEGLSHVVVASGRLRLSPDYDLLALLCERWLTRPTDSGWMRPTYYELAQALYQPEGRPPGGEEYRQVRDALRRLAWLAVTIRGYNAATGKPDQRVVSEDHLLRLTHRVDDPEGLDRPWIGLTDWLRSAIDHGAVIRLDWRILRAFDKNQKLAKRLWIYLQAERWKRCGDGTVEGAWIACGDRLFVALGMKTDRPARQCRASLKRACETIRRADLRYAAGSLELLKFGGAWRIQAERPTWESWRELKAEHEHVRRLLVEEGFRKAA